MIRTRASSAGGSTAGIQSQIDAINDRLAVETYQVVPTEGQTITAPATAHDIIYDLRAATDLNVINLVLPPVASARVRQNVFIRSAKQIGQMTVTSDGVVDNFIVMFSSGDSVAFIKSMGNVWSRVV